MVNICISFLCILYLLLLYDSQCKLITSLNSYNQLIFVIV
jgi:hypothetical protein